MGGSTILPNLTRILILWEILWERNEPRMRKMTIRSPLDELKRSHQHWQSFILSAVNSDSRTEKLRSRCAQPLARLRRIRIILFLGSVNAGYFKAWRVIGRIERNIEKLKESVSSKDAGEPELIVKTCLDRNNMLREA